MNEDNKYYSKYVTKSKSITYKKPLNNPNKKGMIIRGVYDIETNNEEGKFIIGGLALNNNYNSDDVKENYNISFHNKPYSIFSEIYKHNMLIGGNNRFEIAIHNLMFDIQSLLYNIIEDGKITYKKPGVYGKQERNTYSIIMNKHKQIFSCTVNYCGVVIIFWDTLKLYPASLKKLCEVYKIINCKQESDNETYNHKSYEDFISNEKSCEYLKYDLYSLAELVDRNYYPKKTASSNAYNEMQKCVCEYLHLPKKGDKVIPKIINFWGDNKLNDYLLPGYSGGYCYANPKRSNTLIRNVWHFDINSSYPNAMDKLDLPLEFKISKKIESERYIVFLKGDFYLKDGKLPVIKSPISMNEYLTHYKGELLLTDIEYKRIHLNYDVKKEQIIEVLNFTKCERLLSTFVQQNYRIKQESEGFLREKAKLNLNSSYGKLAEHHNNQFYEAYIENCVLKFRVAEETILLTDTSKSRNVIWAMFITSFAREKLYKCIDVLDDNFIYTDTDSIFTDLSYEEVEKRFSAIGEEIHTSNLGAWALEGFSPYFKAIRAKCYIKTDDKWDKKAGKLNGDYRLNYVVAGYNGSDILNGKVNEKIENIPEKELLQIFNNFKCGITLYDKETSVTTKYGIKQVKIKSEFKIKEKINKYDFTNSFELKKVMEVGFDE